MQSPWLSDLGRKIIRILYFNVPTPAVYCYVVVLCLIYVVVMVHTPVAFYATAPHDDTLYMTLARHLAEGYWLGPYNQYTLMKGPGYPAFLALVHWLGISTTLAHALFHCSATILFVMIVHRFIGSLPMSGALLALLMFHPISMTVYLLRVFREEIYYAQALMFLAVLIYTLFYARTNRQRVLFAALAGALLGWFWLTREEGIWIVPAIILLAVAAAMRAFRERRVRALATTLLVLIGVFASTQAAFRVGNWWAYGRFVGVDVKEANFQRALGALSSVRSGGTKPFVTVTRAARARIYPVSPTFASLAIHLDTPNEVGWSGMICVSEPSMCGELGAGWFLWILRDAAAITGHYATPAKASNFYRQIAYEITAACASGALACSPQLISDMPPVNLRDIADRLPSRLARAYDLLILRNPPLQLNPSSGTESELAPLLHFLNYPLHTRSIYASPSVAYTLSGWYYRSGHEWIVVEAKDPSGSAVDVRLDRTLSPDIQRGFNDSAASRQRFTIRTRCSDECRMQFQTPDGEKVEKTLAELARAPISFDVGRGHVHVDSTDARANPAYVVRRSERIAGCLRIAIVSSYNVVFLPVLILGVIAFVAATLTPWRRMMFNLCYVLALTSWLLVGLRASLLILIDVTAFPALQAFYLAPAYFFLVSAAVFSVAAWLQLFLRIRAPRSLSN